MATCYRCRTHRLSRCAVCSGTGTYTAPAITQAELDTVNYGPMSLTLAARCMTALQRLTGYETTTTPLTHSNPESIQIYGVAITTHTGYRHILTTAAACEDFIEVADHPGVDH